MRLGLLVIAVMFLLALAFGHQLMECSTTGRGPIECILNAPK